MPMKEFSYNFKGKYIERHKKIKQISAKAEYTINCQPSIWEKNFLLQCIGDENYNAWVFEGAFLKSKKALKNKQVYTKIIVCVRRRVEKEAYLCFYFVFYLNWL